MKKNISINIGGIIFHIEEDGYEKLQNYLTQINTYFKKYDDYSEIISDIESRIAEIFSAKLNKDKEVINAEDVEQLIVTMGTVSDFASMEEGDEEFESASSETEMEGNKRLYRDKQRKIIGGVCAGLAHYFKVDALWTRILFLIVFFGFLIIPPASGLALIIYIALWIAVPGKDDLEEDKRIKKLYRNPDDKVIGGVSSGLAAYFNVDVAIVRLIFVLSVLFFGSGVIIYIVLWLIAPEAETMTEKMQMKGDPVTLSNIETSVKKGLQGDPNKEENALVTILLFPFRLIGKVFEVLGKAIGPLLVVLGKALRVIIGLFFMIFAFLTLLSVLVIAAALLGLFISPEVVFDGLPVQLVSSIVPGYVAIAGIFAIGIPILALGLLGLRIITMKAQTSSTAAWSMFGVWIIAVSISLSVIPIVVSNFIEDNSRTEVETFEAMDNHLVLDLNELDSDIRGFVHLTIRPHKDSTIKIIKEFSSNGSSKSDALKNSEMITYNITRNDSIILFDSNIEFTDNAVFRDQRLDITMYMPTGQKFIMKENLDEIIYRTIYHYDYRESDMGDNVFVFNNLDDLTCLTCDPSLENGNYTGSNTDFTKVFDIADSMTSITIKGEYKINLSQDSISQVEIIGRRSKVEDVEFDYDSDDRNLEIYVEDFEDDFDFRGRAPVFINISTIDIKELNIYGHNDLRINDINLDKFKLEMAGFSDAEISGDFTYLDLSLEGLADAKISGSAEYFEANLAGKTELDARDLIAEDANIKAFGKSEATVNVTNYLTAYAAGVSEINYYGNPKNVDEKTAGISDINKR
ncbi:MAG: PspC domain-containing protein [Cytophagales bacterium]